MQKLTSTNITINSFSSNKHCDGFGLLEILLATLIFSYGFLSLMNLQIFSWQQSYATSLSTNAINFMINACEAYLAHDDNVYTKQLQNDIKNTLPKSIGEFKIQTNHFQGKICWQNLHKNNQCYSVEF